jgi:hypothetical protein
MPDPDFRALCAKTVEYWESGASQKEMHFFVEYLKAALAQPTPKPPTDEELDAIWWKQIEAPDVILGLGRVGFRNAARAVWALAVGQDNG